jgi:hypothetical protein
MKQNYPPLSDREGPAFVTVTTPEWKKGKMKLRVESPQNLPPGSTAMKRKDFATCEM